MPNVLYQELSAVGSLANWLEVNASERMIQIQIKIQ